MAIFRTISTLALALMCSACVHTPKIPQASLTFVGFTDDDPSQPYIRLASDQDLREVFKTYEGRNQNNPKLLCALGHDTNFDVNHKMQARGLGLLEPEGKPGADGYFHFRTVLTFSTVEENDISRPVSVMSATVLEQLLAGQQAVPCKAYITAYGFTAYYTGTVFIPVAGLIDGLKRMNALERR